MDAEPPPLPPLPAPKFSLPLAAWLLAGGVALLSLAPAMLESTRGTLTPDKVGYALGAALAGFLLPLLLAWLVWRFGGRNATARNIVFFGVLGLAGLGVVVRFVRETQTRLAFARLEAERRQLASMQRDALARGKTPDAGAVDAYAKRSIEQLRNAETSASGDERLIIEAGRVFTERFMAAQRRYSAGVKQLNAETFFDLRKLDSQDAIAPRRAAVKEFRQANVALQESIELGAFHLAQELKSRGITGRKLDETLAAYRATTTAKLPALKRIRETDTELADVMLAFLDLTEANFGQWQVNDEGTKVVFTRTEVATTYNELMERRKLIAIHQANAQQLLLKASAPGAAPKPGN